MDSTRQIFQISKFLNTLSFVIIPRMLWGNLMKIDQIYTSYKFAQSCCIPPYIKHEILAPKGSQTTCAMPGDYLTSWNCTPIGQRDLLVSMMMDQDFLRKVTHCLWRWEVFVFHSEHAILRKAKPRLFDWQFIQTRNYGEHQKFAYRETGSNLNSRK